MQCDHLADSGDRLRRFGFRIVLKVPPAEGIRDPLAASLERPFFGGSILGGSILRGSGPQRPDRKFAETTPGLNLQDEMQSGREGQRRSRYAYPAIFGGPEQAEPKMERLARDESQKSVHKTSAISCNLRRRFHSSSKNERWKNGTR